MDKFDQEEFDRLQLRYLNDSSFHKLISSLEDSIRKEILTIKDIEEASVLLKIFMEKELT